MADNSSTPQGPPAQPIAPAPPIQPHTATGAAGAQQNQTAPARRDRKPRKDAMSVSNATISGIPPMLQLVATTGFHTIQHLNVSRFVPSFNAAAMVINAMNFQMAYTHRFLQGAPAWIPPVSYLYFGVLFMIQTLRAQRESGAMHADLLWLLEGVEKLYDLRSLLVAGPLVPYFQTLSAFAGPFERIGDVTPALPWAWDCTAANAYYVRGPGNTPLVRVLPGIPMYMDIIQRIIAHAGDFTEAQRRVFFTSIMNVNAANNAANRSMMSAPGACFPITFTLQQLNSAKYALANINFPPALDPAATGDLDTWAKFMRFYSDANVFFPWFSQIASIMQRYCQFMQGSVPLSAIPPSGTAAGLPVWTYAAGNANFAAPFNFVAAVGGPNAVAAHYTQNEQISLSSHGSHPDETLEEVSEQTSAIALTNVDFATAAGGQDQPANAGLRDGPVWNLPEVRRTPNVDYALGIPATITTHYHSDTRHT